MIPSRSLTLVASASLLFTLVILFKPCTATNIKLRTKNWNISMETSIGSILSGFSALLNSGIDTISRSVSSVANHPNLSRIGLTSALTLGSSSKSSQPSSPSNSTSSSPFLLSALDPFVASMMSAVEKISANGCFYRGEICYKNLGCFNTGESASKRTCFLPELPSFLRTKFLLYKSPEENPIQLSYEDEEALSSVPTSSKLAFIIHGYTESGSESDYIEMMQRLLRFTDIDSVIIVDYRVAVRIGNFLRAIANTELVGRQVALLIEKLRIHRSINPKNIHLIGYSLGAKVSHFACSWGNKLFGNKIGRVTGLDPGDHLGDTDTETTLNENDADFIDVIHSSGFDENSPISSLRAGRFGIPEPMGHVDFYPNGGYKQPWCTKATNFLCDHVAARQFFIASIVECNFNTVQCKQFNIWETHNPCKVIDTSPKSSSIMGYYSKERPGRGIQFIKTAETFPFC
ncbi:pancreatic lipase-related protein 2 [Tetranychus urticae]|uniref:pancreatic lipase-related protein 2 n=1 Tax=Tetranychus urticae TaxID=32264 RepID=UPI00077B929F|nr:pancreatic lipase-related protein 2 [Tetranychus urticae]